MVTLQAICLLILVAIYEFQVQMPTFRMRVAALSCLKEFKQLGDLFLQKKLQQQQFITAVLSNSACAKFDRNALLAIPPTLEESPVVDWNWCIRNLESGKVYLCGKYRARQFSVEWEPQEVDVL
ncbi:MAG: hypothetical protein HQK52_19030 [Oligoflexia bacterium]|nr:hypothetical protein [Oligoflexia bacterium]